MTDEMNEQQFEDVLRRSLHERPEIPRLADLAQRSIARAALLDGELLQQSDRRNRLVRQRRIYRAVTVAAVLVIAFILLLGYQAVPSGSLSLSASYDYAQNVSNGDSFQSPPQLKLLILGAILFLIAVTGFTLGKDSNPELVL